MTQQLFDEMIGTPPPSTVDVRGVVGRRQRLRRLRQGIGGAALAFVTAIAIGAFGALAHHAPAPPATPKTTNNDAILGANAALGELSARWPDVEWTYNQIPFFRPVRAEPQPAGVWIELERDVHHGQNGGHLSVNIVQGNENDNRVRGFWCTAGDQVDTCGYRVECGDPGITCTTATGPAGEAIAIRYGTPRRLDSNTKPPSGYPYMFAVIRIVSAHRHFAMSLALNNFPEFPFGPTSAGLPLTVDQLIALGTYPGMLPND